MHLRRQVHRCLLCIFIHDGSIPLHYRFCKPSPPSLAPKGTRHSSPLLKQGVFWHDLIKVSATVVNRAMSSGSKRPSGLRIFAARFVFVGRSATPISMLRNGGMTSSGGALLRSKKRNFVPTLRRMSISQGIAIYLASGGTKRRRGNFPLSFFVFLLFRLDILSRPKHGGLPAPADKKEEHGRGKAPVLFQNHSHYLTRHANDQSRRKRSAHPPRTLCQSPEISKRRKGQTD